MSYINAADFDSLELAVIAARGRRLYLPYETGNKHTTYGWFPAGPEGLRLEHPTEIFGDGKFQEERGLRYWADPNVPDQRGTGNSTVIQLASRDVYLHDLTISNNRGPISGTGDAISFTDPMVLHFFRMDRVDIYNAGRCGIRFAPKPPSPRDNNFILVTELSNILVIGCGGRGVDIERASTTLILRNVNVVGNGGVGIYAVGMITSRFDGVVSEGNCVNPVDEPTLAAIYLGDCWSSSFRYHIEQFSSSGTKTGVFVEHGHYLKFEASGIYDFMGNSDLVGIRLVGGCSNIVIEPQHIVGLKASVVVEWDARSIDVGKQNVGSVIYQQRK